jgi:hypothetical protein
VLTIGAERTMVRTKHGLDLVPRHDLATVPALDRMLIPGQPDEAVAAPAGWAARPSASTPVAATRTN